MEGGRHGTADGGRHGPGEGGRHGTADGGCHGPGEGGCHGSDERTDRSLVVAPAGPQTHRKSPPMTGASRVRSDRQGRRYARWFARGVLMSRRLVNLTLDTL